MNWIEKLGTTFGVRRAERIVVELHRTLLNQIQRSVVYKHFHHESLNNFHHEFMMKLFIRWTGQSSERIWNELVIEAKLFTQRCHHENDKNNQFRLIVANEGALGSRV